MLQFLLYQYQGGKPDPIRPRHVKVGIQRTEGELFCKARAWACESNKNECITLHKGTVSSVGICSVAQGLERRRTNMDEYF